MLVGFLLHHFQVSLSSPIGVFLILIDLFVEICFLLLYVVWLKDKWRATDGTPVLSYKSFRRIEQIAPDKWKPSQWSFACVLYYHLNVDDNRIVWHEVRMNSFLDALRLHFGYERAYYKNEKIKKRNRAMEHYLNLWREDVDRYKKDNNAYIELVNSVLVNTDIKGGR